MVENLVIRVMLFSSLVMVAMAAWGDEPAPADKPATADSEAKEKLAPDEKSAAAAPEAKEKTAGPWYVYFGNVNNQPQLHQAQKLIKQQIDDPFRAIAPGFRNVKTFADERDDLMIWTPFVGVGHTWGKHFDTFFQFGYSAGKVHTKETKTSLLVLPFHADTTEKRSSFFAGFGLAYFPLGFVEWHKFTSIKERLFSARPFFVTTQHWNYLTFEADVRAGLQPFGNFLQVTDKRHWGPMSSGLGAGVDLPVTKTIVASFNAQYNFFWAQGEDFSGPGFSFIWKKLF